MKFADIAGFERVGTFDATAGAHYTGRIITPATHEMEIIVHGRGAFVCEGVNYEAKTGSMLWFYPGEEIVARADEAVPYRTCVLRFRVTRPPASRPPFHSAWGNVGECTAFCDTVLRRHRRDAAALQELAECVYARLYWEADEFRRRHQPAVPRAVQQALDYIEKEFAQPVSVGEVANHAGVSAPHLHALFRQHLGTSPKQSILKLRMQKAEGLLTLTGMSVKEVCRESGFNDPSGFCAYFKRMTGMTPGEYRRRRSADEKT